MFLFLFFLPSIGAYYRLHNDMLGKKNNNEKRSALFMCCAKAIAKHENEKSISIVRYSLKS